MTGATEFSEQVALTQWVDRLRPRVPALDMYFHVPNGAAFRHGRNRRDGTTFSNEGLRMKAAGLRAGVADIFVDVPSTRYHGLRIELKRQNGGRTTPEQRDWIERWRSHGYAAAIAHGWAEAAGIIVEYVGAALPSGPSRNALLGACPVVNVPRWR